MSAKLTMSSASSRHPAWIEIDLHRLKNNIAIIRKAINDAALCVPIKANAYGHGLLPIAKALEEAGADRLAVAHLKEAEELKERGIKMPILVLGAIHEDQIPRLLELGLEFSLSSAFKARLVEQCCQKLQKSCRVHLEVDTGMQRTGMRPSTAAKLYNELKDKPCFDIVGIYSHLASASSSADDNAHRQIATFTALMDSLAVKKPLIRHLANSSGTLYFPKAHFDMVRPALLCFGYAPPDIPPAFLGIAPCFSLKAKVSYCKTVEAGEGISYGHTFRSAKRTRIVTIPVGYGDGYRRSLSNQGHVLIAGKRFPIVGTICMDQFMVDVGDASVYVGDEVVLIGRQGDEEISVQEIADLCHTIPYEILCLFNERLPRLYLDQTAH